MAESVAPLTADPADCSAAVAIIGSAGGIPAAMQLLSRLSLGFPFPIIIAQHLAPSAPSNLPQVLGRHTRLQIKWARDGETPRAGLVYVVPVGCQLALRDGRFAVSPLAPCSASWLALPDLLLLSLACCYGARAIGIVLSGMAAAGVMGIREIRRLGGTTMAQNERSSRFFDMPRAAIDLGKVDIVLPPDRIAAALNVLAAL